MVDIDHGEINGPIEFGDGWEIVAQDRPALEFPGLEGKPQQTYEIRFTDGELVDPVGVLAKLYDCAQDQEGVQQGQLYANGLGDERGVPERTLARSMSGVYDFLSDGADFGQTDGFTVSAWTNGRHAEGLHAVFAQATADQPAFLSITVTELGRNASKKSDPVSLLRHFTDIDRLDGRSGQVATSADSVTN